MCVWCISGARSRPNGGLVQFYSNAELMLGLALNPIGRHFATLELPNRVNVNMRSYLCV